MFISSAQCTSSATGHVDWFGRTNEVLITASFSASQAYEIRKNCIVFLRDEWHLTPACFAEIATSRKSWFRATADVALFREAVAGFYAHGSFLASRRSKSSYERARARITYSPTTSEREDNTLGFHRCSGGVVWSPVEFRSFVASREAHVASERDSWRRIQGEGGS